MSPQLIISALLVSGSLFTGFVAAWKIQNVNITLERAERAKIDLESERLARRAQLETSQRIVSAQNEAANRERRIRADADGSRAALVGLSVAADEALRTAATSHNACIDTANTQSIILNQCSERYRIVAEDADRIISDRQTLIDAWMK